MIRKNAVRIHLHGATPASGDLALALHRGGLSVAIVEPDASAAERLTSALSRAGACLPILATSETPGQELPDVVIDTDGDLAPQIPNGTVHLVLGLLRQDSASRSAIGLETYAPGNLRRLAELRPGPDTDTAALGLTRDVLGVAGRETIVLGRGAASAGWHLLDRLHAAGDAMLLRGAAPAEIDEVMQRMGFDLGLYEAQDLAGTDRAYARRRILVQAGEAWRESPVSDRMVREGRLGKTAGVGWYRYPGGGGAVVDPLIEDLIAEEAWFAGLERPGLSDEEISRRIRLILFNAAAGLADAGMTPDDITRVARHAIGYPDTGGGIWRDMQMQGPSAIRRELETLVPLDPAIWTPASGLPGGAS